MDSGFKQRYFGKGFRFRKLYRILKMSFCKMKLPVMDGIKASKLEFSIIRTGIFHISISIISYKCTLIQ